MSNRTRMLALAAMALPLSGCGTLWYESDTFSSVAESRQRAKAHAAAVRNGGQDAPVRLASADPVAIVSKGDVIPETRPARAAQAGQSEHPARRRERAAPEARQAVAASARPTATETVGERERTVVASLPAPTARERDETPGAVVDREVTASIEPDIESRPRATSVEIRDAIFRAWNRVMPEEFSSRSLFGVDPGNPLYAGKGDRITSPDAVVERRLR